MGQYDTAWWNSIKGIKLHDYVTDGANWSGAWNGGTAWTSGGPPWIGTSIWTSKTWPGLAGTTTHTYRCPGCGKTTTSYGPDDPEVRLHDPQGNVVWSGCRACYEALAGQLTKLARRIKAAEELADACEIAAEHIEALSPGSPIAKRLTQRVDSLRRIDAEAVLDVLAG